MPGLFGVYSKSPKLQRKDLHEMGLRMAYSMRHTPWLRTELWESELFCGGRVHLGILNPESQPMGPNSLKSWFDGELFSPADETRKTPTLQTIVALLDRPEHKLAETDGVFTLACYEPNEHKLTLANDHFGFHPLYFTETPDWFAYAAEIKALLAILDVLPELDEISLRQFFGYGYLLGERTWWKRVELIPPASVWRIGRKGGTKTTYWTLDSIKIDRKPEEEAIEGFGKLWVRAVQRRCAPGTMPLLVSGGLDSRMLLAELRRQNVDVTAITFGSPKGWDMMIARRCAKLAGVPHREIYITEKSWLDGREEAIWYTDGLVNAQDLHVIAARDAMHTGNLLTQKSIVGDAIFHGKYADLRQKSGSWKLDPRSLLTTRLRANPFFSSEEIVDVSVGDAARCLSGPVPVCYNFLQNTRRSNIYGAVSLRPYCEVVLPRAEASLIEFFLSSVPEERRAASKFFIRFLLEKYPFYFNSIVWEQTGRGLSETVLTKAWRDFKESGRDNLSCFLSGVPLPGAWRIARSIQRRNGGVANYADLVQASDIRQKLSDAKLVLDEVLNGRAMRTLRDSNVRLSAYNLTAILSLEIYLRQVSGLPSLKFIAAKRFQNGEVFA